MRRAYRRGSADAPAKMSAVTWPGLIWKNLLRRRGRTALTSAGVAIGVGLIVALLSIAAGVHNTADDLIHIGRADFGLFQKSATDLTKSLLPETLEDRIRAERRAADGQHLPVGRNGRGKSPSSSSASTATSSTTAGS